MITGRNIFLILIGLVMVFLIATYVGKCTRAKPVTEHADNREAIMESDSEESRRDSIHRAEMDKVIQAYQDTIREAKSNYKVIVQKDVRIEYRYRQAPSVAGCDSVIESKNSRIAILETVGRKYEAVDLMNDSLITSYQGSIRAKDQTIVQINKGYEQATQDLQQARKPKRFGIGAQVGYGVGPSLQLGPVVSIGVSYNLIRF